MAKRQQLTSAQRVAWIEARIAHYADTRSPAALAQMLVEAEEHGEITPEFEYHEEWPRTVANLKPKN